MMAQGQAKEGPADAVADLPADPQPTEPVRQRDGLPGYPAAGAQPGAVRGAAARGHGRDALLPHLLAGHSRGPRRPSPGRRRWPRPRTGGIASIRGMSWVTSLRLPPVSEIASGMPCASVITWCLEPGRARPAGLGPVLGRPSSPARASRRSPPATSPARPRRSAQPAAIHAAAATHLRRASPADAASRSSRAEPQLLRQELPRNPVDSTNKIPDRTFRSSSRLRPGWSARRGTTGSTGLVAPITRPGRSRRRLALPHRPAEPPHHHRYPHKSFC